MKSKLIIGCMLLGALSRESTGAAHYGSRIQRKVLEYSRQIKLKFGRTDCNATCYQSC